MPGRLCFVALAIAVALLGCPTGSDDDTQPDDDAGDDDDSAEAGTEPPAPVDRFIELTLDAASSGLSYRLDAVEDFPCAE